MRLSVFLAVLCAVSVKGVLGSCTCGSNNHDPPTPECCTKGNACRTYCPKTTALSGGLFQSFDGTSPEYIFVSFGGNMTVIARGSFYDESPAPGEPNANLLFKDIVAYIFGYNGKYYFVSTVGEGNPDGGCARVVEFKNSTKSTIPSVVLPDFVTIDILIKFSLSYDRQCTVLLPRNDVAAQNGYITVLAIDQIYSSLNCQTLPMNNATFSIFKDYTSRDGLGQFYRVDGGFTDSGRSPYFCEYASTLNSECGVPSTCPMYNSLEDYATIIRKGKCDPDCINPYNMNAPNLLARCYVAGLALSAADSGVTTSYRLAITGPPTHPNAAGFAYFEIAGETIYYLVIKLFSKLWTLR